MSNTEAHDEASSAIPISPSSSSRDDVTPTARDPPIARLSLVDPRTPSHSPTTEEVISNPDDTARPQLSPYLPIFSSRDGVIMLAESDPTNAHPSSVISRPSTHFPIMDEDEDSSAENDTHRPQLSPYRSQLDNRSGVTVTERDSTNVQPSSVFGRPSAHLPVIAEGSSDPDDTNTRQFSPYRSQFEDSYAATSTERDSSNVQPFSVFSRPFAHLPVMDEGSLEPDDTPYSSQFRTRDDYIDDLMAKNNFVIPEPPVYQSRDGGRLLSKTDWKLREKAREGLELRMRPCWLDQDNSGDYDPNCEFSEPKTLLPSPPKRPRLIRPGDEIVDPLPKKPKISTWQTGRKEGSSLSIVIKVASDEGKAFLTALKQVSWLPDNWPEKKPKGIADLPNFTELHLDSIQPQRLRQRNHTRVHLNILQEEETERPGLADVTLGHPAARGCKNCFEINLPCSLLAEGEKYPCRACKEDEIDCELIAQPLKKRACENCRRRKIVCSYRTAEDHSQPCRDCLLSGGKCVAGPLTGRTRTGPSLDSDTKQCIPTPERPYKSCTGCRKLKKRCSLELNPGYHSCTHCDDQGQKCTFEPLYKRGRKPLDKSQPTKIKAPQDLPVATAGLTKTIKTGYAHPISINYDPPADGCDPCHWCENLAYGIFGLPQRRVEVIDYQNGEGYVEIQGGHTADGVPPSRMCTMCTSARMQIIGCSAHEIQLISAEVLDTVNDVDVMQWMDPEVMADAPFEWCSVCTLPASYRCGNAPAADMRFSNEPVVGCGLMLCEDCTFSLVNEHGGDLTAYLGALEEEDDPDFTVRADACFLRSDGHLLSRICR
ncbi:hypothetical protein MMC30_007873 [Trapelia coarctata]|nr:hypothetical protein [Trapelia coarctata]